MSREEIVVNKVSAERNDNVKLSKKSRRKKRLDDDEDELNQMLAELAEEYSGKKKKDNEINTIVNNKENNNLKNDKFYDTRQEKTNHVRFSIEPKKSINGEKIVSLQEDVIVGKSPKNMSRKSITLMQEAVRKAKEEEERLKREEEEQMRLEEERENIRLNKLKIEQEKKEKKKQKEKERKDRLKAEGKYLTTKQKADRARSQLLLDSLRAQGLKVPDLNNDEKKSKIVYTPKQKKKIANRQKSEELDMSEEIVVNNYTNNNTNNNNNQSTDESILNSIDTIKDAWDDEDEDGDDFNTDLDCSFDFCDDDFSSSTPQKKRQSLQQINNSYSYQSMNSIDNSSFDEIRLEKVKERIRLRNEQADNNRNVDNLRSPIICVLGHVDTGKTKILDRLRRTNVQDGEAGGITQQIGATNVPIQTILEQTKITHSFDEKLFKIPGLLIIDTPGHESFSNLRNRGSSLCDIAILVIDIMHGIEPQTIESINILKLRKTPFVIALNKIDRLYNWKVVEHKDIRDVIETQSALTRDEFDKRVNNVITQLAEQKINARLFMENSSYKTYIQIVPTSAVSGEGMGNLLATIVYLCQVGLTKRLMYSEQLQARVLEVKAIPGLGTTIDIILINGVLREGDTIVLAGIDGPFVTQIRSLLMPEPLRELRVKSAFIEHKEIKGAQGAKIAAKELDKAIAGLNLLRSENPDEIEVLKADISEQLKTTLQSFKLQERGVYVQASTLGSLEALLEFLRNSKIPYYGVRIGPVAKRDVMKASIMLEHNKEFAVILAFDVKVDRDAQELADNLGVKIFQADIIYHLFDKFVEYQDVIRSEKRDQFKHIAVFPCRLKILPQYMFNTRDPIVCGVIVDDGVLQIGTPICVPKRDFIDLGIVSSIESNHKAVEKVTKGTEVCIKIDSTSDDTPKMFGRHFDDSDFLVSKITRQSIDACKEYFRDDLSKSDWQLMIELKKTFGIV